MRSVANKPSIRVIFACAFSFMIPNPGLQAGGATFDHALWDRILKAAVDENGWVDYEAIRARFASDLDRYLKQLAAAHPDRFEGADEKKAFWINAYNALCVRKLLDHGLPEEVPHAWLFGTNIFKERTYTVAGAVRSLDDIEHRILRPRFKDPRIHAAVVCGASSCPRLRPEAYRGRDLDRQLDEEARRWIQTGRTKKGQRKNYLDRKRGILYLSKIFDWYAEDFGGERGAVAFYKRYATAEDRAYLERHEVEVEYLDYDWSLNRKDKKPAGKQTSR